MSDEPKWTPGPWVVQQRMDHPRVCPAQEIFTPEWDVVSSDLGIRRSADAHLIAAAPKMYAALEGMLELYEVIFSGAHETPVTKSYRVEAEAALAEARGESNE